MTQNGENIGSERTRPEPGDIRRIAEIVGDVASAWEPWIHIRVGPGRGLGPADEGGILAITYEGDGMFALAGRGPGWSDAGPEMFTEAEIISYLARHFPQETLIAGALLAGESIDPELEDVVE